MQTCDMQELLLAIMPQWYCYIAKPFKKLLDEGMSLDMYYCIRILGVVPNATMTELSRWMHMSKQQTTKLVDKMIDHRFVERVSDPNGRRMIHLKLTSEADKYTDAFLSQDAVYYRDLFESMPENEREEFGHALEILHRTFNQLQSNTKTEKE